MLAHSIAFGKLDTYLRGHMRMSHIYQPVMLLKLLQNKGRASTEDIAKALRARDASQVEYYEQMGAYARRGIVQFKSTRQ